jgi:hypothetical protein
MITAIATWSIKRWDLTAVDNAASPVASHPGAIVSLCLERGQYGQTSRGEFHPLSRKRGANVGVVLIAGLKEGLLAFPCIFCSCSPRDESFSPRDELAIGQS